MLFVITRISLTNFKLHASTVIDAAPITVLIGPNNSGKSSLLQALLALRRAAHSATDSFCLPTRRQHTTEQQPYLFPAEEIVDIGEFKDVVRHGQSEIQIGLAGTLHGGQHAAPIELGFEVSIRENRLVYHKGQLDSSRSRLNWEWTSAAGKAGAFQAEGAILNFLAASHFRLLTFSYADNVPPEKRSALHEFGKYLGDAPVHLLNSLHPIFPLRGFEEWGSPLPDAPAGNLERATLPDRAVALASIFAYDREMEKRVSRWLEEILGIGIEVQLLAGKRVTVRSKPVGVKGADLLFLNEGTGANQLPFLLVPIALAPPNETLFLCEPEAHLHPKAQSEVVGLLLTIAGKERRHLLIETHSEHILHGLLHAVARGTLEKDQLAIYYFENVNGTAEVRRLEINSRGQVHGGLPGFFEHSLAELSEYLEALKKS